MKQIIEDYGYKNGFALCHTDALVTRNPVKILNYCGTASDKPSWKVCQWCSRFNLANGSERVNDDYSYEYSDETKNLRVWLNDGRIRLSLAASKEYTHPRREGEGWPHILLEQGFSENHYLHESEYIEQDIDFTIESFSNHMSETDRTELHTAQFQWFLAIQNRNKKSKGYGDFFWFGLPFFDYPRYDFPPEFKALDGGKEENTGKFINIIDSKEFLKEPVTVGKNVKVSLSVAEYVKEAFLTAKQRGYLKYCEYEDMCIGNMNVGFEVTGTFDVSVLINKINIFTRSKR